MPASKAQQRAVAKYMAANYDEIKVRVPKGRRADFDAYAKKQGESVNGLINRFMRDSLGVSEEEWKHPVEDSQGSEQNGEAADDLSL